MASLVRSLTRAALRVPALTVVVVLLLTGVLGSFAAQSEQDQGQESFSPDNEALTAADFASESFEGSLETIVQVVVEGDDVVSPEGLETVRAVQEAITAEIPAEQLSTAQGSRGAQHLLDGREGVVEVALLDGEGWCEAYRPLLGVLGEHAGVQQPSGDVPARAGRRFQLDRPPQAPATDLASATHPCAHSAARDRPRPSRGRFRCDVRSVSVEWLRMGSTRQDATPGRA